MPGMVIARLPPRVLCSTLGVLFLAAVPALAQSTAAPEADTPRGDGPDLVTPCAEGEVRDDGSVETGWGWVSSVIDGIYLQEYRVGDLPTTGFERTCVCWLRTRSDASIDFEVVFYQAVDGIPADTPYAAVPARAEDIPQGVIGAFTEVATPVEYPPGLDPDDSIFVGVRWNPSVDRSFFVCADTSPTTPESRAWFRDDRAGGWDATDTTNDPLFVEHRAIFVRPVTRGPLAVEVPATSLGSLALLATSLALVAVRALRR